ncbi:putative TPR-repeat-containing chaperone protein DNAJ,putative [Trypanosoma rangeli]|uniref:Putative TPR-repeat-containing chaperone protein DNAJ,putative n=1 Tax=Trypanosoma rangeli TaxID=5698 RepID=A0A422NSW4_TRYRA|nr:putative TPR-repeat-containing chaperone protein DNAJ,putative [Trypanosoma rangeli]RNF08575.1 putative TPR-repeat-containing chaperone protein DNAJ,putative [Trypanosoma rangeli]|eukprot:RNF08575.1 putative TPR-repeat-containing chaperone protein DNAJ,putative [Trypanosoma rangeli]
MHPRIMRRDFSQTVSPEQMCLFPRIDRKERRFHQNGVRSFSNASLFSQRKGDMGRTSAIHHGETTWEWEYCAMKKKRAGRSHVAGCVATMPTDGTCPLRRVSDEEGACRRLMIANEAIERKHLVGMLQGCLPELNIRFTKNEDRGIRLLTSRDYGGAYVSFTRALQQNPQSKIARYKRAMCSWHLLLYDECIEDACKGGGVDLGIVSLHCRSLLLRERYAEARQCYDHALHQLVPSINDPRQCEMAG